LEIGVAEALSNSVDTDVVSGLEEVDVLKGALALWV
jgi:hypothetical protein